jgi:4-hydroxy-4-methyl-2-oxoglutarate aldolase
MDTTTHTGAGPDQATVRLERLSVAVVADCLDRLGLRDQVMHPRLRPLAPTHRFAGRAHTAEVVTVDRVPEDRAEHYRGEIQAVDTLQPVDVLIASTCQGSFWGELLSTAAQYRGARGIVGDAYTRDVQQILDLGFPGFFAGIHAADSLGRIDVASVGTPVTCGDVLVHEGDYVLADYDGVVVVPSARIIELLERAEEKAARETDVRGALAGGDTVREVFDRFGIL